MTRDVLRAMLLAALPEANQNAEQPLRQLLTGDRRPNQQAGEYG
jgi:hypothetical protein